MFDCSEDIQIDLARKYLKIKIMEDDISFRGHEQERAHVYDLMSRTVEAGESNSALIIGPRGSGKSTLVNNVLWELGQRPGFAEDCLVAQLHGLLHSEERVALKCITSQMSLDNACGDRVFGSFSENLSFLLSCLSSGGDRHCRSVLFILEEFDLFCHAHSTQTLLYNLFDVAQSRQAPVCVIGLTCRLDVIELLEKRVKSRFSHRQIFIFPNETSTSGNTKQTPFEKRIKLFTELLSLPVEVTKPQKNNPVSNLERLKGCDSRNSPRKKKNDRKLTEMEIEREMMLSDDESSGVLKQFEIPHDVLVKCQTSWREFKALDPIFVSFWNENVKSIAEDKEVREMLQRMYNVDVDEVPFRQLLFQLVCQLSSQHPQLEVCDVVQLLNGIVAVDHKLQGMLSLSILELCLLIAIKHHGHIFQAQPMNFEMIYHRYSKFANTHSSSQSVPRAVVLKAFEHLHFMEMVAPLRQETSAAAVQKEHRLYRLLVTPQQILEAVKQYKALPTEVEQWAGSSLV